MSNTPFMVQGKPFFPIGGQTHNSSSQNTGDMSNVWKCLEVLNGNSIASPVFWERIEPVEGQFDFSQVDMLISECRKHDCKLVILWFASWKNAASQYVPKWVKTNKKRFVYCKDVQGATLRVLSPICEESRKADAKAFKALMQHIREVDENEQTVIAVQVENEAGIFGTMRDYSEIGQKAYKEKVPAFIFDNLKKLDQNELIYRRWQEAGGKDTGTWEECFGLWGGEFFSAYYMASYISSVAKAGKEAYNLPMYVNIWLSDIMYEIPGIDYPAGICGSHLLDYWKWCGPDIDFISPDHYLADIEQYEKVCAAYSRPDNPLYIPESGAMKANAVNIFRAIGKYDCVGIHCFGLDSMFNDDGSLCDGIQEFADSLKVVRNMEPLLHKYRGTGRIYTVTQDEYATTHRYDFARDYIGVTRYYNDVGNDTQGVGGLSGMDKYHSTWGINNPEKYKSAARGLIIYAGEGVFYAAGVNFRLELIRRDDVNNLTSAVRSEAFMFSRHLEFLEVEEGHFDENGNWTVDRVRTGDETDNGIWVAPDVGVVKGTMDMTK